MKGLKILCLVLVLAFVAACSTDFDLNSDYREIAVVYGLLDSTEPDQYLRVTRAFIDGEIGATTLAQDPAQLYFQNAEVKINEYSSSSKANLLNSFSLERINAADPANNVPGKDEGLFVNDPHYVYKMSQKAYSDRYYEMELTTDDGNIVTAETAMVDTFVVTRPKDNQTFNLLADISTIKWQPAPNGVIYDLVLNFTYREEANNDPSDFEIKTLKIPVFRNLDGDDPQYLNGSVIEFRYQTDNFYNYLVNNIDASNSADVKRIFQNVSLTFFAGGKELQNLYEVNLGQQSGLTGGAISPGYTNINSGLGILSSRYSQTINPNVAPAFIAELVCGERTKDLGFDSGDVTLSCD